ncbi:putative metal-dependent hydrolase of the TIM-barrel fold protein [Thalassovita gelatinovora]|uniref:Putative metal-dependent hydrolase of the TIM-barrel fold protein n=1 Tax=Thalassovita gelatinovora TaxID=53501 RepID=A0A0P1F871_THAGE|nr:amidohydrolase family protein [Thalassovita gelatinovora]QIZ80232.1 amidohydrolase family protein [Thalassovita gelatinovora]CUH64097.1 putative metal-dependent hydrolase of the TIM-barrel fold protein [Thalassovita gelatinovora]SEQ83245.1 Predicted metal-dependent hydrolase, TIM-barrel fold [Thalassovita gelatinovora]
MRYPENLEAWHDQVREDIIDPDREITDPHHHFWSNRLGSSYELDDLWGDTQAGHNVTRTVFIECRSGYDPDAPKPFAPVGETRYVAAIAAEAAKQPAKAQIAGIVAHADLRLDPGLLSQVLEAHEAASPLFRGIRHAGAWDEERESFMFQGQPVPHLYVDPDFQRGVRALGARGLTYDTWHFHPQNGEFLDLAKSCPDTTIILNHFGTPVGTHRFAGKREDRFAEWQDEMAAIARCPNVVAKLGGLAMPVNGFGWNGRITPATSDELVAAQAQYYHHMIDVFGPDRAMFESNFPVDKLSIGYVSYWNAMKKIAARYDDVAQQALFSGTANRIYRL